MQNGYTALRLASEAGHLSVVDLLLKHNARVDLQAKVVKLYLLCHLLCGIYPILHYIGRMHGADGGLR